MPASCFQREVVRFLLGNPCLFCRQRSTAVLCPACRQELRCCFRGQLQDLQGLPIFTLGAYEGVLRQTLQGLKYQQARELGWWLGVELGKAWCQFNHPPQRSWVLPIPIHRDRQQQRGYNQAHLLAEGFCRVTGDRLVADLLVRDRPTSPLYRLSRQERQQAMQGAFQIKSGYPSSSAAPVLLLDDILTTGSTLIEAHRTLQRHGIHCTGAVVLALTPAPQVQSWDLPLIKGRKLAVDPDR